MACGLIKLTPSALACWHEGCACLELGPRRRNLLLSEGSCDGWLTTAPIEVKSGFHQATLSWNIRQPEGTRYKLEWRVTDTACAWSDWCGIDTLPNEGRNSSKGAWRWEIDQFLSSRLLASFQVRVRLEREILRQASPLVDALYMATRRVPQAQPGIPKDMPEPVTPIALPFLNQYEQGAAVGPRICSATSVSMVLAGLGIAASPFDLAQSAYHTGHDLYGIWPLAIHAAYQLGAKGWVEYFDSWRRASKYLKRGIPLVASIAFEEGDLAKPPYAETKGHLLVLLGIDSDSSPVTHDPRLPATTGAFMKWNLGDFTRAWFGHGGVAYVFGRGCQGSSMVSPDGREAA
jgi:hypothetical protein